MVTQTPGPALVAPTVVNGFSPSTRVVALAQSSLAGAPAKQIDPFIIKQLKSETISPRATSNEPKRRTIRVVLDDFISWPVISHLQRRLSTPGKAAWGRG